MADELSVTAITCNLGTSLVGRRVIYYPRLASTMDQAKQEARQGAEEGTVIIAGEQTWGRGRLNRRWLSPRGSLALSVILYPHLAQLPSLIMLASLAVSNCILTVTGLRPQIKWPNDVLVNGRKVCGILIESDVQANRVNHAVIGIGINVNIRPGDFPEIPDTATSLAQETGEEISLLVVIRELLGAIEGQYQELRAGTQLYPRWRDRLVTLGKPVTAQSGSRRYQGIAESVDPDGSLWLRLADGSRIKFIAGDVTLS